MEILIPELRCFKVMLIPILIVGFCGCSNSSNGSSYAVNSVVTEANVDSRSQLRIPRVEVKGSPFCFGIMAVGDEREHAFTIRNIGDATLKMQKGTPGCSCISFEVDKVQLDPGESTEVRIRWTAKREIESFEQHAVLTTNDPLNKKVLLTINGTLTELISVRPSEIWPIGSPRKGQDTQVKGVIVSSVLGEFSINSVVSSSSLLTTSVVPLRAEELDAMEAKSGYTLVANVSKNAPLGKFEEQITINTSARNGFAIPIRVVGYVSGAFQLVGKNLDRDRMLVRLGTFDAMAGKKESLSLFLPDSNEKLEIVEVVSEPRRIQILLEKDSRFLGTGQKYFMWINVPPSAESEVRNDKLPAHVKVKTNHSDVNLIDFRLHYTAIK